MNGLIALILAKKYTDNSIAGGGISAGKNCVIDSITDITGGHRVTFKWTLDNGTVQTGTMDVMDGVDGTDGTDGTDGFSPTISITEITGGHTVTITDAEGEHTFDVMDGQDGATELSDLTDLALTNVQDGQILKYDAESGKWKNVAGGSVDTDLGDLNDVDLTNIQDGQMIAWDAQNSKWVNVTPSADIESLNDIDDVDITSPSNGQMLKYNGTSEKWENSDMPTIDATPTENSTNAVQSGGVFTALGNKVDKVSGKGLSTEDYTSEEKTKLSGIAEGAEANVQSDWNQSNNEADDFIKNKPTLGTAAAKDSTTYISPGNNDVPTANSVYQAMTSMLNGAFHPAGNKTCAELTSALLIQENVGNVYKITDNGTTDANWVGGAGQTITANQNAVVVYGNEPNTFLFNLENGINIDMSAYQTKAITPITVDGSAKSNVEDALSAINDLAAADKTAIGNIKDGQSIDSFADVETALGLKADKSEMSVTDGTGADADKTTIQLKNGTSATVLKAHQDITGKADKISSPTNNNLVAMDANGNIKDSGYKVSDFVTNDLNLIIPQNAGARNSVFRGQSLGTSITAEQLAAIAAGTFDGLCLGDYWTIDGVVYRIADFDYWLRTGDTECTDHHIVVVPDENMYTAKMNSSNITTGGYVGSEMRTTNLATAKTTIQTAFGSAHILSHRELLTKTVTDGKASDWGWYDSDVELMSECMVYGSNVWASHPGYETGIDKSQLSLFRVKPSLITSRAWYWLRNVVSASGFAAVGYYGSALAGSASNALGVRPCFAIK